MSRRRRTREMSVKRLERNGPLYVRIIQFDNGGHKTFSIIQRSGESASLYKPS